MYPPAIPSGLKSPATLPSHAVVLTFFPHPRMVLQKDVQIKLIDTLAEKETFLKSSKTLNSKYIKRNLKDKNDFIRKILPITS